MRKLILIILFLNLVFLGNANAKDLILGCTMAEMITKNNNKTIIDKRSNIVNPTMMDGYIHYDFNKKILVSNLSRLGKYGAVNIGENKLKNITLVVSDSSNVLSFVVTYGILNKENWLGSNFEQNTFSIDKYNKRMTAVGYIISDRKKHEVTINYLCKDIPKPNF